MNTIEYLRIGDKIPYAGELPEVTVRPRKIVNKVWDKIHERWIGDVPTYYGVNPDTGKEEMLREIGNGKYSTYDDKHVFDVLAAKEARKQKEQWIRNGGNASNFDKVILGYLGLGLTPIVLPEAATGIWAASQTPAGLTLLAGTLGGEAWEALNHGITGQSWGNNLGDVIGLNKNNYIGRTALGLTNPFYGLSPSMVYKGGEAVLGAGKTALDLAKNTTSKSVEALQNKYPALFDPYTSWDATLGYHGDNIFSRAVGTIGRRHGYTPKAEIPEFHRRLLINEPETFRMTDDGKFIMSSGRTGDGHDNIVNFATSEPARGHNSHRSLSGINDFIIPSKVLKGVEFKSIQPSDTFFEVPELSVNPKQVTLVSGDPETLKYARSLGMRTLSSPRLRHFNSLNQEGVRISGRVPESKAGRFNFDKGAEYENAEEIGKEIQRLTSMRGAPTMQDYTLFESQTGLNSGVIPNTSYNLNNRIDLLGRYGSVRSTPIFNNVIYDPATNLEAIYRKAKIGKGPWSDYYEALEKMPSARQQLGLMWNADTRQLVKVPINKFTTAKSVYDKGNMSDLEIFKAAGDGFKEAIAAYKPGGVWYERQIANGVPKEKVDKLASEYLNSLYNTSITIDKSTLSDAVAVTLPRIEKGIIKSTLIMDPRYTKNYELTKDAAIHEAGHASTKNIEPVESIYRIDEAEPYYKLAEEVSPETKEAMEYNESIRPKIKDSALDKMLSDKTGNAIKHFKNVDPQLELRQRAFAAELDAARKNVTLDEYMNNPSLWNLNFKLLAEIYDMETLSYYMKHYKTMLLPLLGGSTAVKLYNK